MARFSSVAELSPAGTVVNTGTTVSNAVRSEAATDGRMFVHVTVKPAGAPTLDVTIEASHDLTRWAPVAAFNQIIAIGDYGLPLKAEQLGTYTRLKYVSSADGWELGSALEKKQGT